MSQSITTSGHAPADPRARLITELRGGVEQGEQGRRAAVELLITYQDGLLLDHADVRAQLRLVDGVLTVGWLQLYQELQTPRWQLLELAADRYAALFACALAIGTPMPALNLAVVVWSRLDTSVMVGALAYAAGLLDPQAFGLGEEVSMRDQHRARWAQETLGPSASA